MRNLYLIPTTSMSGVAYYNRSNSLKPRLRKTNTRSSDYNFQHIYITDPNKELIKGDVFILNDDALEAALKVVKYITSIGTVWDMEDNTYPIDCCDKVVMSTNTNLMGVDMIDSDFIDWFVNNQECESVEIDSKYEMSEYRSILDAELGDWIKSPSISSKLICVDKAILDNIEAYFKDDYRLYKEKYSVIIPGDYVEPVSWLDKEDNEMDFTKQLSEYFKNTPIDKILTDWKLSESFDEIGPTVSEFEASMDTSKVTRLEVIRHPEPGSEYISRGLVEVELQLQDDGKTLKIFTR
jgi:hypothetical protein